MLAWEAALLRRNAGSSRSAAAAAWLTISSVRRSSASASSYFPREYIGPLSDWIVFAANSRDSLGTAIGRPRGSGCNRFLDDLECPAQPEDRLFRIALRVEQPADAGHGPGFDQVDGLGHAVGGLQLPGDRQRFLVGRPGRLPVREYMQVVAPGRSGPAPGRA